MKENETAIEVKNRKERIIPAEESLLLDWAPVLEDESKGSVLIYLQLQRSAYDGGSGKKSKVGIKRLAYLCSMSEPTVAKCLATLNKYELIKAESGKDKGVQNTYTIYPLPVYEPAKHMKQLKEEEEEVEFIKPKAKLSKVADSGEVEVFGNKTVAKMFKEKAESEIAKMDDKEVWNCNDVLAFYKNYYQIALDGLRTKEKFTSRERGEVKRWIEEYSWEIVRDTIKFALDNWSSLDYFKGYPSINALYGYRETLVPEMQRGIAKNKRGQHKKSNEGKEVGSW